MQNAWPELNQKRFEQEKRSTLAGTGIVLHDAKGLSSETLAHSWADASVIRRTISCGVHPVVNRNVLQVKTNEKEGRCPRRTKIRRGGVASFTKRSSLSDMFVKKRLAEWLGFFANGVRVGGLEGTHVRPRALRRGDVPLHVRGVHPGRDDARPRQN